MVCMSLSIFSHMIQHYAVVVLCIYMKCIFDCRIEPNHIWIHNTELAKKKRLNRLNGERWERNYIVASESEICFLLIFFNLFLSFSHTSVSRSLLTLSHASHTIFFASWFYLCTEVICILIYEWKYMLMIAFCNTVGITQTITLKLSQISLFYVFRKEKFQKLETELPKGFFACKLISHLWGRLMAHFLDWFAEFVGNYLVMIWEYW